VRQGSRASIAVLVIASLALLAWFFRPGVDFTFAVVGDTQGSPLFRTIIEEVNGVEPEFLIHLGDCVPISTVETIGSFSAELEDLHVPFHITPGNHDVKGNSSLFYREFGGGDYHFEHSGVLFISLDSSNQSISESQFSWLESILAGSGNRRKVVFTHVPSFNPLPGESHGFIDTGVAARLREMMEIYRVDIVIAGHIHLFNHTRYETTEYIVSGGGGARLYAGPEDGGYHHYLLFHVDGDSIDFEVRRLEPPEEPEIVLMVEGRTGEVCLTLPQVKLMRALSGTCRYQNSLGNWRGGGTYRGVPVADLVNLVGDMTPGDTLRAESRDGYYQEFCYWNVFPNASWAELQGEMVVAYGLNGTGLNGGDGFTVAFLPADGEYSNQDCLLTSCEGQGCSTYLSGGARWAKDVVRLRVIAG